MCHTGSPAAGGLGRVAHKRMARSSPPDSLGATHLSHIPEGVSRATCREEVYVSPLQGAAGQIKKPVRGSSSSSSRCCISYTVFSMPIFMLSIATPQLGETMVNHAF